MYTYRIAISTDPYHAGIHKSRFTGGALKYAGPTVVKAIQCFCTTLDEGRELLRRWAREAGGVTYDNGSLFEEEHVSEPWYEGPGIYDPVSHECMYHFGSDCMHQDIFTFSLEENDIPLDIYLKKAQKAENLQQLLLVMEAAEDFYDLDAADLIKEYIESHPSSSDGPSGIFKKDGYDFVMWVREGDEMLAYSESRGWFILDIDSSMIEDLEYRSLTPATERRCDVYVSSTGNGKKILAAGLTVIRKDDTPGPRIKQLVLSGARSLSWKTFEMFDTKAARDRRFKELLQAENVIDG